MELPLQDPVIQFTVLVGAALLMQLTVERVHLPGILGLLAVGALLGPGGAAVLPREPVVSMLGEIGLIYVMFIAGVEIDLDVVKKHRIEVAAFGLLAFFCSALPAAGAGLLVGYAIPAAVLLGALVSSHTLLAYPVLVRLKLLDRRPVITAVGGTLLTDTLALVVLAVVLGVHGAGGAENGGGVGAALLPLGLLVVLAAAALLGLPRVSRRLMSRRDVSAAEKALFVLAVLMLLATTAELIGTDEILGAFLAGIALNRVLAGEQDLREHIEFTGRMLFIPFFFIWTGTLLEFEVLVGDVTVWRDAGMLFGLVVAGKGAAAWITGAIYGYRTSERLLITALTIPQAAATLAVTVTAREAGIFDAAVIDAVIILIVLTCLAGPIATDRIGRRVASGAEERGADEAMHTQVDDTTGDTRGR